MDEIYCKNFSRYILWFVLVVVVICACCYLYNVEEEYFLNGIYSIDWSDPNLIKNINSVDRSRYCRSRKCAYSVFCDFSDDSMEWCDNGFDVPDKGETYNVPHYHSY